MTVKGVIYSTMTRTTRSWGVIGAFPRFRNLVDAYLYIWLGPSAQCKGLIALGTVFVPQHLTLHPSLLVTVPSYCYS